MYIETSLHDFKFWFLFEITEYFFILFFSRHNRESLRSWFRFDLEGRMSLILKAALYKAIPFAHSLVCSCLFFFFSLSLSLAPFWESRSREEIGAWSSVYRYHVCLVIPRFHVQMRRKQLLASFRPTYINPLSWSSFSYIKNSTLIRVINFLRIPKIYWINLSPCQLSLLDGYLFIESRTCVTCCVNDSLMSFKSELIHSHLRRRWKYHHWSRQTQIMFKKFSPFRTHRESIILI